MTTTYAGPRLLAGLGDGQRLDLAAHLRVHGPLPELAGRRRSEPPLIGMVEAAGVRGHGGAGYPAAAKLRAVRSAGRRPVVVVNASEGEPLSQKDSVLLMRTPHLVLDGAVAAARALGAKEAVVYLHRGRPAVEASVVAAVAERADDVRLTVVAGPARYVAGESSAAANFLSGGPALPVTSPPRVSERGVSGRPTYLSNAETFAHISLVARHGAQWYREVGTAAEPGTLLLTLAGEVGSPGIVEVAFGTSIAAAVALAGGVSGDSAGVLLGGYAGTWLRPDAAWELPLAAVPLRRVGAGLGVGLIAVLPEAACVVAETASVVGWLADESARQCGPCLNGLPAIAAALRQLAHGPVDVELVGRIQRWCRMVEGRGSCHHPGGTVQTVTSLLRSFDDHVTEHLVQGPCTHAGRRVLPIPGPARGPDLEFR